MRTQDVLVGSKYLCKVAGRFTIVCIDREAEPDHRGHHGGWFATNIGTSRSIHIRSARRLRKPLSDKTLAAMKAHLLQETTGAPMSSSSLLAEEAVKPMSLEEGLRASGLGEANASTWSNMPERTPEQQAIIDQQQAEGEDNA